MAEGLLGGFLGGDDDAAEPENGADGRASAEAFAAVVAAEQARHDTGVAEDTRAFLKEQALLLRAQREEVEEQRALRLRHLQNQSREGRLRRFGLRIRNGLQVLTAAVFGALGLGLMLMVVDAFTSRSVVVDPFKAPSALAGRGLTGDVVASGVLDELQKLQEATRLTTKALTTRTAWSSDVKIEVPETGVSLGEITRLLHARFGHDVHIDGDLVQTAEGGLALTVRGDGISPKTFTGGAGDLDKLTTEAAEYVYGRSQPFPYAQYLVGAGRYKDALASPMSGRRRRTALNWPIPGATRTPSSTSRRRPLTSTASPSASSLATGKPGATSLAPSAPPRVRRRPGGKPRPCSGPSNRPPSASGLIRAIW